MRELKTIICIMKLKTIICIMLALAMLAPATPVFAKYTQKYDYDVHDILPGQIWNAYDYRSSYDKKHDVGTDTFRMFRLRITQPGVATIYCSNATDSLELYRSFKKDKDLEYSNSIIDMNGKRAYYLVLPKGTYYLHANNKTKIRYIFEPAGSQSNYCRSTAKRLAAGKQTTVSFQYGREHSQYYKAVLSTKRSITVTLTRMDEAESINAAVYTKRGKLVSRTVANGSVVKTKALEPGNYYIRVWRDDDMEDDDYYIGRVARIRWN